MRGKCFFTSRDHHNGCREIFPSLPVPGAETIKVSDKFTSGFLGFGVAITPSSCYELSLMDAEERRALLRHIYTEDGIGLSVARLCIASSDYSPEIYSYDDVEGDVELRHFSIERDERYVLPMIKEILEINPDLYIFASPWSPPYWMKTGGSMCGGYMRDAYLDCYADYIIKFINAYGEHGIKISAITPQNEPETQQRGCMPACIWHPETEAKFIKILRKKLNDANLDVKIWMHDHNFDATDRVIWSLENCEGLESVCDGVAFHYYSGTVEETLKVTEKYPSLELHYTEGGPRLTDHYDTDYCKWALMAVKTISAGYRSFTGWNLMLDELGSPNVGPFIGICGGLVTRDSRTGELSYSGQYKAFSHIAPYISEKSKIYPLKATLEHQLTAFPKTKLNIEGILVENPDGRKIALIVNPGDTGIQAQVEIGGVLWYLELLSDSVSTLIIED